MPLSKKSPFSGTDAKDSDPKGHRSIEPESPRRRSGHADKPNGTGPHSGAPAFSRLESGAYPEDKIAEADSHAVAIATSNSLKGQCGQGGKQDL